MGPYISRGEDGGVVFSNIPPWLVSVLLELPELLEPDQPDAVRQRLYPEPSGDPDQSDEWRKFVHPELFSLLASAREIVTKDLGTLAPIGHAGALAREWELKIPDEHVHAWISALNAARLTLGALHEIVDEDMSEDDLAEDAEDEDQPEGEGFDFDEDEDEIEDEDVDPWDEKRFAIAKIHLLGWLQQMIIEDRHPRPPGMSIPDSLPPDF